jgi:hypothetical protein
MIRLILNDEHMAGALGETLEACRHRLFICTADVKDLHLEVRMRQPQPAPGATGGLSAGAAASHTREGARPRTRRGWRRAQSIVDVFRGLSKQGIEVRLLHSGVPSGPFLAELKEGIPKGLVMRRCPRVHAKALIADGRLMYLGSANLTGAGLGAKSARRRNFEAGIWTDELPLIDPVLDMLDGVWNGTECEDCGRKDHCPVPLEEPRL